MNCAIHTDTPAVAYCRTCGKALCENCKRDVMGAIYCEPCIAARLQSTPPPPPVVPVAVVEGAPSPALAALLGMIPGVGAMYNGQFVKAFIHVVIFALLIVAAANISGLFGLLIGFFVLYMMFEAHETAKARRYGRPAPDFLGLDRLFGVQEATPPSVPTPPGTTAVSGGQSPQPATRDSAPTGAIILVALGVFFLLDNFHPHVFHKMWPLLLVGVGLWIAYRRATGEKG
jgi:TM2 domain-containing membrane protein YozV